MRILSMTVLALGILAIALPQVANAQIDQNEAERIAADAAGGIPNGNADHRIESDGYPYWFVEVEVNHQLMVVKVGANTGKVYEMWEYGSHMPRGD